MPKREQRLKPNNRIENYDQLPAAVIFVTLCWKKSGIVSREKQGFPQELMANMRINTAKRLIGVPVAA